MPIAVNWKLVKTVLKALTDALLVGRNQGWWEKRKGP